MLYLDKSHRDLSRSDRSLYPGNGQAEAVDRRAAALAPPERTKLGIGTRRVIVATAVWSLIEFPFEMLVSLSARAAIACITAKVLWIVLIGFVLAGNRVARIAYGFLCTIGLMAVAFALPNEYRVFPVAFVLSSVECVLKATAFVCLVSAGVYPDEE